MTKINKPAPHGRSLYRLVLLPFVPFVAGIFAIREAIAEDSLRDFLPNLWWAWRRMTLQSIARNSFWPEAGWCWHYDEPVWRRRFVLHDPIKSGKLGWTWVLADADFTIQQLKQNVKSEPRP
jgi:hypothetical protein